MIFWKHFLLLSLVFNISKSNNNNNNEYLLDTTQDISGGNWFITRDFYKRSEKIIPQLNQAIIKLGKSQDFFIDERVVITKELIDFYSAIGFQQGQLELMIQGLMNDLQKQKLARESKNETNREIDNDSRETLAKLNNSYKELEQFLKGTNYIKQGDLLLDAYVKQVLDIINTANSYNDKAWKKIEEIKNTFDHEKANNLYNEIENSFKHVESLDIYINNDLKKNFEHTIDQLRSEMQLVRSKLADLQERGLIAKAELSKEKSAQLESDLAEAKKREQEAIDISSKSWWQKIIQSFVNIWACLKNYFCSYF